MQALPSLPYLEWRETRDTLHRWLQIVGKIRLALTPRINHWWNVPFYVSARGLTTTSISVGERRFEIEFDFGGEVLRIRPDVGSIQYVDLRARTVADFYASTMAALRAADIECRIWTMPVEIDDPIPFEHDTDHRSYDKAYVMRFWHILSDVDAVLTKFRARYLGKCSPVHFFWGSFDLAVTRFSGRRAPTLPTGSIEREAYSHEVSSVGWWPGDHRLERAAFYSYASPEPPAFARAQIANASYNDELKGFYLDHDDVRHARDPEATLLAFCESTYAAAADLGAWPRSDLERFQEDGHGYVHAFQEHREPARVDDRLRGMSRAR